LARRKKDNDKSLNDVCVCRGVTLHVFILKTKTTRCEMERNGAECGKSNIGGLGLSFKCLHSV